MIDKILPFLVGHRTELIGIGAAVLKLAGDAGLVTPEHVSTVIGVMGPLAVATFAAKVQRIAAKP